MYPTRLYLFWNTIPSLRIPSYCGCNIAEYDAHNWTQHNRLNANLTFKNLQHAQNAQNTFSTLCWCVSCSQPFSHLSVDHVVLNSLHFHNYKSTNEFSLSSCRASLPNYCLQIEPRLVLLQSLSIMASKYISKLAWSQPPSVSLNSHVYGLQTPTITASKVAPSRPPSVSWNSLDYNLQVHLQTCPISASKCVSHLARVWFRMQL